MHAQKLGLNAFINSRDISDLSAQKKIFGQIRQSFDFQENYGTTIEWVSWTSPISYSMYLYNDDDEYNSPEQIKINLSINGPIDPVPYYSSFIVEKEDSYSADMKTGMLVLRNPQGTYLNKYHYDRQIEPEAADVPGFFSVGAGECASFFYRVITINDQDYLCFVKNTLNNNGNSIEVFNKKTVDEIFATATEMLCLEFVKYEVHHYDN